MRRSHRICAAASRFIWITGVSSPPTMSSVGETTRGRAAPARSGRPPRETTAKTPGRSAADQSAAPPPVLKAVGLSDAEVEEIVRTRVRTPYPSVPGRFGGRGLTTGSAVFRIEAEGLVGGVSRSQLVALVRRGRPGRALDVSVLSWRRGAAS